MMGSSGCGKTTLISCLVGVNELDEGKIEIFGDEPSNARSRIGYMPQETALINEFSIREMIWFYGTIFGLNSQKLDDKVKFLSELLELPDVNKLVKDCSGGQQRRISFALTLVHDPELLILDEPTVGMDPLLRAKIWDFLVEITKRQNVTVLLSTHYIEEARQSTHVGLMRNGVLVAEDSPQNVLCLMNTNSLEEAFLKLCTQQDVRSQQTSQSTVNTPETSRAPIYQRSVSCQYSSKAVKNKSKRSTTKIVTALLIKNFKQIFRSIE